MKIFILCLTLQVLFAGSYSALGHAATLCDESFAAEFQTEVASNAFVGNSDSNSSEEIQCADQNDFFPTLLPIAAAVDCYSVCRSKGNSENHCRMSCGGSGGSGGCYTDCKLKGNSDNQCRMSCGGSGGSGGCYTDCKLKGNSDNECRLRCNRKGPSSCFTDCKSRGISDGNCRIICGN